ncbi:hypothetical protein [Edaphobacillus lindanitolerans]|uniref:Uncharacterized protein n=1 Tax=Edaphobacillus lindanitolerans TaxID=550447 RepID=A0A1U7PT74_9BACI|nr:hypothetical protein [Edaphobacillus lindanitolerans]SIT91600.1 hypothetical protein SAMN05428946_2710 [Edaphobacillus lindanitolerans]
MTILIRFMEEKFVEDFMKGHIYMKSNQYFIDLEKELGVEGIGDKYEGAHVEDLIPGKHEVYLTSGDTKIKIHFTKMRIAQQYENIKKFPILCSLMLTEDDFEHCESENKWVLRNETYNDFKRDFDNRTAIIIVDFEEFKSRVNRELNNIGVRGWMGKVTYYDSPHPLTVEDFDSDPIKALFYKRKVFEHQREYRIVVEQIESDHVTLDVGDISDIAKKIDMTSLASLQIHLESEENI